MKFKISIFILLFSITAIVCDEVEPEDWVEIIEYDENKIECNRTLIPFSQLESYAGMFH